LVAFDVEGLEVGLELGEVGRKGLQFVPFEVQGSEFGEIADGGR
jgi:hypothetical protein